MQSFLAPHARVSRGCWQAPLSRHHILHNLGVRCNNHAPMVSIEPQSIFDVAQHVDRLQGPDAAALRRLYAFTYGTAKCSVGPELSQKYNMEENNTQHVVSVTNKATLEQAWFNEARTRKPQTFKTDGSHLADPTDGGRNCDFCRWRTLTAEDVWGRFERPHAVTGSNLFKYGEPAHGLVLFKHHDPLAFNRNQLGDFLSVSSDWFAAAAGAHPEAPHAFFLWNCGPRAGASQYHGHGQLMLTRAAVPAQARLDQQSALHVAAHPGSCYYRDLVRAHAAVGLARVVGWGQDRCWLLAHLAPQKDMELLLLGSHLISPALLAALHAGLRALVDGLGAQTFNCGILNVPLAEGMVGSGSGQAAGVEGALGDWAVKGGREGEEGSGVGLWVETCGSGEDGDWGLPVGESGWRPVLARVVSRGRVTSPASDFGCLEVVGHASIGHTDPFVLIRKVDEQLAAAGARVGV